MIDSGRQTDDVYVSAQAVLARRDMKTWTLIRDLEEAVFNLKEHLLNVDARSSTNHHSDIDVVGNAIYVTRQHNQRPTLAYVSK